MEAESTFPFLLSMTILLLVAGACSVIFKKLKMPPIIGYIVAGIIIGYLLFNGYIFQDQKEIANMEENVKLLANMGLVLLMFVVGMELNLKKLKKSGAFAIMVALIQIPLMVAGGYLFGILMGWGMIHAILFGAIISGSSTAVVTIVLKEQGKLSKEDIESIVLITVIEDVAQVIILSMATPLLIGGSMELDSVVWMIIIILTFMSAAVVIGIITVPRALEWIASKMPDEVLLVTALGICFAMALLSVVIGMSMAIGAFLMGVVVSQSSSRTTIEHDITPMKDIFMAMFFISVGLQITPGGIINNIVMVVTIFAIYTILKTGSVFFAYFVGNKTLRVGFISAVSLVAMGEFAFIIAYAGLEAGVLSNDFYTAVVSAALVSMVALPILSHNATKICDYAGTHAPKSVLSAANRVETFRNDQYARLTLTSKHTASKFKEKVVYAYAFILLLAVIEAIFFFFSTDLAEFINRNTVSMITLDISYTIVLMVNFVIVAVILYKVVRNLKFVGKVLLDAERKAGVLSKPKRATLKVQKAFIRVNNWALALVVTFIIIVLVPNGAGIIEHIFAMLGGMGLIGIFYAYKQITTPTGGKR